MHSCKSSCNFDHFIWDKFLLSILCWMKLSPMLSGWSLSAMLKRRNSFPNVLSPHRGPNINLKIFHKRYSNQKEKEMFFEKIKRKKKTELCKNYELYKDCYYGDNCSFAHGIDELRENALLPSYKTKLCKSFEENNVCNFGIRCSYQHKIK